MLQKGRVRFRERFVQISGHLTSLEQLEPSERLPLGEPLTGLELKSTGGFSRHIRQKVNLFLWDEPTRAQYLERR